MSKYVLSIAFSGIFTLRVTYIFVTALAESTKKHYCYLHLIRS